MKIRLLSNLTQLGTNIKFFKGKIYNASAATNQPKSIRFINKKTDVLIKKVFVQRGNDSMLVDQNDFTIVDFPKKEHDDLFQNYLNSKIKTPRIKRIVPAGLELRPDFRKMTEKELNNLKYMYCNTYSGGERCGKPANFIRVINPRVKICTCLRHATNKI